MIANPMERPLAEVDPEIAQAIENENGVSMKAWS